jgi:DNA polymerase III delta prime subunit
MKLKNRDKQFAWVEKYRPKTVEDTILPAHLKKTFKQFVNKKDFPNLILAGRPGIGKTTVAMAMLDELKKDYIIINGSLEGRQIDTLRHDMTNYVTTMSLRSSGRKYIIIDEADLMNPTSVQPGLRNFMEAHSQNCGFILTCNFRTKIIDALYSRCSLIEFDLPKKERPEIATAIFKRISIILKEENVEFDPKVVAQIISKYFPDFRHTLNELQKFAIQGGNKIDVGCLANVQDKNVKLLMGYLKEKELTKTIQWLTENDMDSSELYRALYETGKQYIQKQSIPALILILAKYQYQDAFVVDKEINTSACLLEIMTECLFI